VLGLLEHLQGVALAGDGFFFVPFSTKATRFELPLDASPFVLDGAGEASRGGDDPVWANCSSFVWFACLLVGCPSDLEGYTLCSRLCPPAFRQGIQFVAEVPERG
jgi:hypothetical protein